MNEPVQQMNHRYPFCQKGDMGIVNAPIIYFRGWEEGAGFMLGIDYGATGARIRLAIKSSGINHVFHDADVHNLAVGICYCPMCGRKLVDEE